MGKAWTIKDARGKTVLLWGGGSPNNVMTMLSKPERVVFSEVTIPSDRLTDVVSAGMLRRAFYSIIVSALGIGLALFLSSIMPFLLAILVAAVVISPLMTWLMHHQMRQSTRTHRYIASILGINRCPACLYQLSGNATEPDGCVACPECGGAWRRPAR